MLIYIGIKYVLSGANERANLKGTFTKYLIGVAFIVLCSTISGAVAKIANTDGTNTATGIVDKGFELGKLEVGNKTPEGGGSSKPDEEDSTTEYHTTAEAPSYDETMTKITDYSNLYSGAVTQKTNYDDKGRVSEVIYYDNNRRVVGKDEYKYNMGVFESSERVKEIKHVSSDGSVIGKESFKYTDSSTQITTEKDGKKQELVTVNYRPNDNTVAAIIKQDIIDNSFFVKEDEYVVTDMQIFDDRLYEGNMKR